jgi:hypothetical protein
LADLLIPDIRNFMMLENPNSPSASLYLALSTDITLFFNCDTDGIVRVEKIDNQSHRRHIVRAIAAFVEAMTFQLRRATLETLDVETADSELMLALQNKQIDISPSGKVVTRSLRVGSIPLIKFSLNAFDSAFHTNTCPDFSSAAFKSLVNTFFVRDRLMHPKGMHDIDVNNDELVDALQAFSLIEQTFGTIIDQSNKILSSRLTEVLRKLELMSQRT